MTRSGASTVVRVPIEVLQMVTTEAERRGRTPGDILLEIVTAWHNEKRAPRQ